MKLELYVDEDTTPIDEKFVLNAWKLMHIMLISTTLNKDCNTTQFITTHTKITATSLVTSNSSRHNSHKGFIADMK